MATFYSPTPLFSRSSGFDNRPAKKVTLVSMGSVRAGNVDWTVPEIADESETFGPCITLISTEPNSNNRRTSEREDVKRTVMNTETNEVLEKSEGMARRWIRRELTA